ncbi:MAG: hypothetical protein GY814_03155 [Gammaproteobacteria bacterium]|nr:hypothetical protein [Gammaproteobacteria bacterium]
MKSLFSNLSISYASSFVGFVIFLLIARLLGVEQFSWVALGLAVGSFINPLTNLGSARSFVIDAVNLEGIVKVDRIVIDTLSLRLIITLLICLFLLLGCYIYTDNMSDYFALVCLSLWAGLVGLYPASWFDYAQNTKLQNKIVFFERVITLLFVFALYMGYFEQFVLLVLSIGLLIIRVCFVAFQVGVWWKMYADSRFMLACIFPFTNVNGVNYRYTLALISNAVLIYGNQLLLAGYDSPVLLSSYSMAFQIITPIFLFHITVVRMTSKDIAVVCRESFGVMLSFGKQSLYLLLGGSLLSMGAYLVIELLPIYFLDPTFGAMSDFSYLLCIWVVIAGVNVATTHYLLALQQENYYLLISVIGGLLAFFLGKEFIPYNGPIAVALILLVTHSALTVANASRLFFISRRERC